MANIRKLFATTAAPLAILGLLATPVVAQSNDSSGSASSGQETGADRDPAMTGGSSDSTTLPDANTDSGTMGTTVGTTAETGTMGSGATTATPDMDYEAMAGVTVVSSDGEVLGTVESASAGTAGTMLMITPDASLGMTDTSVSVEAMPTMDADGQVVLPMTAAEFEAAVDAS